MTFPMFMAVCYPAGTVVAFAVCWSMVPRMTGFHRRREQQFNAIVLDASRSPAAVGKAARAAQRERDCWFWWNTWGDLTGPRGFWSCVLLALSHPVLVVLGLLALLEVTSRSVFRALRWAAQKPRPVGVACDQCHAAGPRGWTYLGAQRRAVRQGWAVALPLGEDLCPACKTAEQQAR